MKNNESKFQNSDKTGGMILWNILAVLLVIIVLSIIPVIIMIIVLVVVRIVEANIYWYTICIPLGIGYLAEFIFIGLVCYTFEQEEAKGHFQ
jgi:uncharacterized integral membrane protein